MKKIIISLFVAVSLVSPALASAAPTAATVSNSTTVAPSCVVITRTIYPGARSDEVSKLQSVLNAKGYLDSTPTGFFGAMTSAALKKFQADNKLETTGSVGPRTRALIQSASCATTSVAPVVSIAPVKPAPATDSVAGTAVASPIIVAVNPTTPKTKPIANDGAGIDGIVVPNVLVDNFVATFGPSPIDGHVRGGMAMFSFTLTNNSKGTISVSKIPSLAVGTSTEGSAGTPAVASSTLSMFGTKPFVVEGDTGFNPTSGSWVVLPGTTRQFTFYGFLDNTNGVAGIRYFRITNINYTDAEGNARSFTKGIPTNLVVSPWLEGGSAANPGPVVNSIGLRVENASASFEPVDAPTTSNENVIRLATAGTVTFKFTAVSTGNKPIYISKLPRFAAGVWMDGAIGAVNDASTVLTDMTVSPEAMTGDKATGWMSGSYIVPAGTSREFTMTGHVNNANGVAGLHTFKVTQINFGSSPQGSLQLSSVATPDLSISMTLGNQAPSAGGNSGGSINGGDSNANNVAPAPVVAPQTNE